MEHRYNKRFPSHHKTLIFKNGMPVAIGRIDNFSRGGVFIRTEINLVDINQALEIELIARGSSRLSACYGDRRLCKTLVMHKADDGIGLMLREDCEETQKNFAEFFEEEFELQQASLGGLQKSTVAYSAGASQGFGASQSLGALQKNGAP